MAELDALRPVRCARIALHVCDPEVGPERREVGDLDRHVVVAIEERARPQVAWAQPQVARAQPQERLDTPRDPAWALRCSADGGCG